MMEESDKHPTISVIIPAYNQAEYISESIHSVLSQTCPDFELIVVNDGSTDDTAQVIANIQDPRLRVIWQPNAGLSAARNTGIRESTAPLITFLDADDCFFPEKLEILSRFLDENPNIGLVSGGTLVINQRGEPLRLNTGFPAGLDLPFFLMHNPFSACAVMVRRSWINKVGVFDESLKACEDWDLWHRLLFAGCQFAWVEHAVVTYRYHSGQMTREAERMREAIFLVLDKFYKQPDLPKNIMAMKDLVYSSGHIHAAAYEYFACDFDAGNKDLTDAIRLDPTLIVNNYQKLVDTLIGWTDNPRSQNQSNLLEQIIKYAPKGYPDLIRALLQARADVLLRPLFSGSRSDWVAHRKDLLNAVRFKPQWLLNRGVLRMLVYAYLRV